MPVQLNKKLKNILDSQAEQTLKNRLIDDEFFIKNSHAGIDDITLDVSFKDTHLTTESKIILRHAIVATLGGYHESNEINDDRNYLLPMGTFLTQLNEYLAQKSIKHILEQFKFEQYYDFLNFVLSTPPDKSNRPVYSLCSMQSIFNKILNSFSKLAALGEISWGTTQMIKRPELIAIGCRYIEKFHPEIDVMEWQNGGSFETVSLSTAILMLNYSLEQLNSLEHIMLTSYFDVCRELENNVWYISSGGARTAFHNYLVKYKTFDIDIMDDIDHRHKPFLARRTLPKVKLWYEKTNTKLDVPLSVEQFIELISNFSQGEIERLTDKYYECSLTVISILTGIRVHELVHIKAYNAINEENGLLYLITRIDKTHQGFPVERSTGDAVSMAINTLLQISYVDKTQKVTFTENGQQIEGYYSIFFKATTRTIAINKDPTKAINRPGAWLNTPTPRQRNDRGDKLNSWLRRVFNQTLNELTPELREEVLALNETITVHAFRHTFVDFLLRRFDGDVLRAIRRCFAHSSKDPLNYIQNYIRNKVTPQAQKTAERAYTQELIKKIAGDINHSKFSGASVEYVRKKLEKMKWTTMDELDEQIYDWVSTGDERLIRLVPHSYGFCMLFNGRENLAQCRDKNSGTAKTERGESKMCVNCPNFAVKADSHLSTLEQLQMVHQNILAEAKDPKNLMSLLGSAKVKAHQESSRIIKTIDILTEQFKQMEA